MLPPYTSSFGYRKAAANETVSLFVAPPSKVSVLRDLLLTNHGTTSALFQVAMLAGQTEIILLRLNLPQDTTHHLELRQVIEAGNQLTAYSPATQWSILATGYLLTVLP